MEIREAILKAADWIEKNPSTYNFLEAHVPSSRSCGTPGCMAGWCGFFMGLKSGDYYWSELCRKVYGISTDIFMQRNLELDTELTGRAYAKDGAAAAKLMRLYADKYHPAEPKLPSGAEVCRAIILKHYKEREAA